MAAEHTRGVVNALTSSFCHRDSRIAARLKSANAMDYRPRRRARKAALIDCMVVAYGEKNKKKAESVFGRYFDYKLDEHVWRNYCKNGQPQGRTWSSVPRDDKRLIGYLTRVHNNVKAINSLSVTASGRTYAHKRGEDIFIGSNTPLQQALFGTPVKSFYINLIAMARDINSSWSSRTRFRYFFTQATKNSIKALFMKNCPISEEGTVEKIAALVHTQVRKLNSEYALAAIRLTEADDVSVSSDHCVFTRAGSGAVQFKQDDALPYLFKVADTCLIELQKGNSTIGGTVHYSLLSGDMSPWIAPRTVKNDYHIRVSTRYRPSDTCGVFYSYLYPQIIMAGNKEVKSEHHCKVSGNMGPGKECPTKFNAFHGDNRPYIRSKSDVEGFPLDYFCKALAKGLLDVW